MSQPKREFAFLQPAVRTAVLPKPEPKDIDLNAMNVTYYPSRVEPNEDD